MPAFSKALISGLLHSISHLGKKEKEGALMRAVMPLLCQSMSSAQMTLGLFSYSDTDLYCAHGTTFSLGQEGRTKGWTKVKGTCKK